MVSTWTTKYSVADFDSLRRYKNSKYQGSEDRMKMHELVWAEKGAHEGIEYNWQGKVANTLQAHRLLQHYQEKKGPGAADKILSCMLMLILTSLG